MIFRIIENKNDLKNVNVNLIFDDRMEIEFFTDVIT